MKYQKRRRADLSGRMLRGEDLRDVDWRHLRRRDAVAGRFQAAMIQPDAWSVDTSTHCAII